jgi:hypothetical protein
MISMLGYLLVCSKAEVHNLDLEDHYAKDERKKGYLMTLGLEFSEVDHVK